jgi:hypothetical protein
MRRAIQITAAALFATAFALHAAEGTKAPPNILFVLSDDHSYPYLGCYG